MKNEATDRRRDGFDMTEISGHNNIHTLLEHCKSYNT